MADDERPQVLYVDVSPAFQRTLGGDELLWETVERQEAVARALSRRYRVELRHELQDLDPATCRGFALLVTHLPYDRGLERFDYSRSIETLRALRRALPGLAIVVYTGASERLARDEALLAAGAAKVVRKSPLRTGIEDDGEVLLRAVDEVLAGPAMGSAPSPPLAPPRP
jgi:DNA-binding NarL/FixJ family response regulator